MTIERATAAGRIVLRLALSDRAKSWLCAAAIVGVLAICAAHSATDADWDLRNYHAYNAHALLNGRFWTDIAPAQLQTFYCPFMDIAVGAIREHLDATPVLRNIVLSLPQGIAAALAFILTLRIVPASLPARHLLAMAATAFSAAGAAGYPTLATAMSEMLPGVCILGGLLLLTNEAGSRTFSAGLLFGVAAGLKLTSLAYCAGAAAALLAVPPPAGNFRCRSLAGNDRWRSLAGFVMAGAVAAAFTGGPWWALMDWQFGNPVLPYLNQVFHSPFVASRLFTDPRFLPRSPAMALFYPFYWALQARHLTAELAVRDPRFAIAMLAWAAASVQALRRPRTQDPQRRACIVLAVGFIVTFAIWETLFSILRYLATLELLTGAMLLLALRPWLASQATRRHAVIGFVVVAITAQSLTVYPDWGRVAGAVPAQVRLPVLPDNALLVLLDRAPMAYVANVLPITVHLVGANNNLIQPGAAGLLAERAEATIRGYAGPIYGMEDPVESPGTADVTLAYYRLHRGDCTHITSNLDHNAILLCRLLRQTR